MAVIKKCDRCETIYNDTIIAIKVRDGKRINIQCCVDISLETTEQIDLCESCRNSFAKWWESNERYECLQPDT